MQRKSRGDVAALTVAVIVLAVLALLRASISTQSPSVPSTYDTGQSGYAALYSLLAREKIAVGRFETPLTQLFAQHGTLAVAGDGEIDALAGGKQQRRAIDDWIRAGGRLLVLGSFAPNDFGLPRAASLKGASGYAACGMAGRTRMLRVAGDFGAGLPRGCTSKRSSLLVSGRYAVGAAFVHGRGTIVWIASPSIFDNAHLAKRDNAAFAYALFSGGGPVAFEERIYGHAAGKSFWSVLPFAMQWAILLACAAVLVAVTGENLPFAPPYEIRSAGERDSGEYISSLSRMLERGGARRDVIRRLCRYALAVVTPLAQGDEKARTLASQARALQEVYDPRAEDVAAAGRIFACVQKEYGT